MGLEGEVTEIHTSVLKLSGSTCQLYCTYLNGSNGVSRLFLVVCAQRQWCQHPTHKSTESIAAFRKLQYIFEPASHS